MYLTVALLDFNVLVKLGIFRKNEKKIILLTV